MATFYIWWLFLSPEPWHWWAVAIPLLLAIVVVMVILGWIGYVMASTPPPTPIEEFEKEGLRLEKGEEAE